SLADLVRSPVYSNLIVVPSGPLPLNPAELLSSSRVSAFLQEVGQYLKDGAVIIDSGPLLTVTDASALATRVDGCVVVVDSGRTQARAVRRAIDVLRQVHAPVLGIVLNKLSARQASSYRCAPSGADAGQPRDAAR